ncbi:AsmA-like C-terminal region-containing protein, partial [Ameyamaea chiangmaiensis]
MDAARPVALHALVPEAAGLETPVALHGWLDFRPAANPDMLQPRAAQATLALGQGAFVQADGSILWLRNAHAAVRADLDSSDGQAPHLDLTDMAAAFQAERDAPGDRDVTLAAHGRLEANDLLHPRHVSATLDAVIPRLDFATILQAWPYGVAKGARAWISRNITQGTGERLTAHVGVAGNDGWQHLRVTDVAGGMDAHGLDIHWLRPVPPMHGVDGHLTFDDPTSLSITFEHGYQEVQRDGHHVGRTGEGRLTAGQGSMRIEHLDQRFQTGDITVRMAGDLADAVALLDEKRLNLLARHPFPFTNPSGRTEVELRVTLPLRNKVAIDDVTLDAHARETDIHLGNAVMGRSVDHGNIVVSASTQGLTASGTLLLGGVPSRARYSMDFARNPAVHVTEQGHLTAHLTPQTAEGARIPASRFFGGSAAVDVDYGKRSDDTARIALALDMKDADVHIPIWHKPAGRPGNASVVIDMAAGHLSGVHDLVADGPDLDVRGHTEVHDGTVDALAIDRFRIGRSAGRARVRLPRNARDPYQVTVRASAVDLSPLLHGRHQPGGAPEPAPEPKKAGYHLPSAASGRVDGAPGQSWSVDLATPVLYYDDGRTLSDVTARLVNNGVRLTSLDFAMRGPSPATVTVRPDAGGRRLSARVDDTGALLGATGVMSHIDGGVGTLEGRFDDRQPSAPFAGTLSVGPFVMRDAPGMLRLVNDLSVFGWFDGQSASDFPVDHLAVPLRFQDGVLHIDDGEVGNRSVGATVQGHVDLDHDALDLNGTLTPAFAVNALPGRLPGVGRLFSPERGGGVLSATYTVTGPIAGPKLHVNPLSVLLPGIFRKMVE